MVPKPHAKSAKKALRKKKVHLKFNVECKNPVEDGILRIEDLVSCRLFKINQPHQVDRVPVSIARPGLGYILVPSKSRLFSGSLLEREDQGQWKDRTFGR